MVIFCIKASTHGLGSQKRKAEITFRQPNEMDFLGSAARRNFLLPRYEVSENALLMGRDGKKAVEKEGEGGVLTVNGTGRFEGWQQQSALGHWAVMRTVLPPDIWQAW